jgi:hypothetical protein
MLLAVAAMDENAGPAIERLGGVIGVDPQDFFRTDRADSRRSAVTTISSALD